MFKTPPLLSFFYFLETLKFEVSFGFCLDPFIFGISETSFTYLYASAMTLWPFLAIYYTNRLISFLFIGWTFPLTSILSQASITIYTPPFWSMIFLPFYSIKALILFLSELKGIMAKILLSLNFIIPEK